MNPYISESTIDLNNTPFLCEYTDPLPSKARIMVITSNKTSLAITTTAPARRPKRNIQPSSDCTHNPVYTQYSVEVVLIKLDRPTVYNLLASGGSSTKTTYISSPFLYIFSSYLVLVLFHFLILNMLQILT